MSIKIHFLSSSRDLIPYKKTIRTIVKSVECSIRKITQIKTIDIVFYSNPGIIFKKNGIGGSTPCANTILVTLNTSYPNFKEQLKGELPYTLAHEINHAIRFRIPIKKETLFETIISEGLADHFAMKITKRKSPQIWSTFLTKEQINKLLKKASREWNKPTQYHYTWFYGSKKRKIPCWTGYSLGYYLVDLYFKKNIGTPLEKLISSNASIFLISNNKNYAGITKK